jgi:uncharacterized membrane protein YdjX (TVP38/TMEM64 family)
LALALGLVFAAIVAFVLLREDGIDSARSVLENGWGWLQEASPIVFFTTMTLALLLPIPASLFYVTAGSIYGITPSLVWIIPVLVVNSLIVHWASSSFLRPGLEWLVERRGHAVPALAAKSDQILFISLIRITPGIPYFLQNLILALAGVDRLPFLLISVPVQMIYATGFVALGRSAFDGELGLAVAAIALIAAASITARLIHKRLESSSPVIAAESEPGLQTDVGAAD